MSSPLPFTPENRIIVMRLYRNSLKLARDWICKRDHFRTKAMEIRAQFDLHKDVSNPKELRQLVEHANSLLLKYRHPDPYIPPTRPGGTKFERYIAPVMDDPMPQRPSH